MDETGPLVTNIISSYSPYMYPHQKVVFTDYSTYCDRSVPANCEDLVATGSIFAITSLVAFFPGWKFATCGYIDRCTVTIVIFRDDLQFVESAISSTMRTVDADLLKISGIATWLHRRKYQCYHRNAWSFQRTLRSKTSLTGQPCESLSLLSFLLETWWVFRQYFVVLSWSIRQRIIKKVHRCFKTIIIQANFS